MRTRVFKSGNSQAVRIPKELQLPPGVAEVEIEAVPGGMFIRLERRKLAGLSAKFAAMGGADLFPDGRPDQGDEETRAWESAELPENTAP